MFIISVAFVCRAGVVRGVLGVLGGLGGLGFEILGSFKRGASTEYCYGVYFPHRTLLGNGSGRRPSSIMCLPATGMQDISTATGFTV
jgi:hypothetical protein